MADGEGERADAGVPGDSRDDLFETEQACIDAIIGGAEVPSRTGVRFDEFMRLVAAERSGEPADPDAPGDAPGDVFIDMIAKHAEPFTKPDGTGVYFALPLLDAKGALVRYETILNAKGEPMEVDFREAMMRRGGRFATELLLFGEGPFRRLPPRRPHRAAPPPGPPPDQGQQTLQPDNDQTAAPEPGAKPEPAAKPGPGSKSGLGAATADPSFLLPGS